MIKAYYQKDQDIYSVSGLENLDEIEPEDIFWVDLLNPKQEEKESIETRFHIELLSQQEAEEIESSSRYREDHDAISINVNYLIQPEEHYINEAVSFILKGNLLISQRTQRFRTFRETERKINTLRSKTGTEVFLTLMETRIDHDADEIEAITDKITRISRELTLQKNLIEDMLLHINKLQEITILLRENIIEKQRIISAILKSRFFPKDDYENIRVMIKDVGSLLVHTSFNFERLEFLQNTFLGLIDIEQNRIVKIFTVVTVVFLPPTLIASIYGMNFTHMPELNLKWGYPLSILLMILSSAVTLIFFKRKNWL